MSYQSIVMRQSQKENNHYDHRRNSIRPIPSLQNTHSVPSITANTSHHTIILNGRTYHTTTGTHTNNSTTTTKPRYPMWGNSACSISTQNGIHSTNAAKQTHHNYLHGLHQRLHVTIQRMNPQFAETVTPIIIKKTSAPEIQRLLQNTGLLWCRVAKEIELLPNNTATKPHRPRLRPTHNIRRPERPKSSTNSHKTQTNKTTRYIQGRPSISRPKSYKSVSAKSVKRAPRSKTTKINVINHIHQPPARAKKPVPSKKKKTSSFDEDGDDINTNRDGSYGCSMMEEAEDEAAYDGLPSTCSIQVLRVVVNIMIPKQIFELLLETLCIKKANCAQKIFMRSHKSIYHADSSVIYIHFVNFDEYEYRHKRDTYFDFVDRNGKPIGWYRGRVRLYTKKGVRSHHKPKRHIFDIMGNDLGLIRVHNVKEYDAFNANIHYLSRIVNICLRCKINKASARKRVCSFCINDEREDRGKIIEYYRNPSNNAIHKSVDEIQRDLIKLKIELYLIPLTFRSECNKMDIDTRTCKSNMCSFVHTEDDREFGRQLNQIRSNALQRQYAAHGEFELNDYRAVKLQLKYRHMIGRYYNKHKMCAEVTDMESIKRYLTDKDLKLYLIPTVYKNWCYYAKDTPQNRACSKRVCTFIHDENEKLFGDLLWKIKYDALQEQLESASACSTSVNLMNDDDVDSSDTDDVKAIDPMDKWWRETIGPYRDANYEELDADRERMEKWRMDAACVRITSEAIRYEDEDAGQKEEKADGVFSHSLFVEFEDDKSAKIHPMRTYVDFTFKCEYAIDFEVMDDEANMRAELETCDLIRQFMSECQSVADWLRLNHAKIYKRFRSRVHIASIIASFAVTPDKNCKDCAACYFNVCDGVTHKMVLRHHNETQLKRPCCGNDLSKARKHKFDTRKCDILHGVIVEMERRHNIKPDAAEGKTRYKALINRSTTNDETYLKFLIIGSDAFNSNRRRFKDILVSYPCNTHQFQQIKERLELLEQYSAHREHEITQIIFGCQDRKPRNLYKARESGDRMSKGQIGEVFGGRHALNKSQIDAVYGAIHYNLYTIQGPPATGKTDTCSHIAYLWWRLEDNEKKRCKIHGMAPTNQGALLLANKCDEMNRVMQDTLLYYAQSLCDGFIRPFCKSIIPRTIRDLCLRFYREDLDPNNNEKKKSFKVLYFASQTYANIIENRNILQKQKGDKVDGMTQLERVCVNLSAEYHVRKLPQYDSMSDEDRKSWKARYIMDELDGADMICTTFGNSCHRYLKKGAGFTHAIADECNQSSLDTLLGIIGYRNMRHLTMAGDIRQLSPVSMCSTNALCRTSVYEHIIRYLTSSTFEPNEYYTRLNEQYRSHPQIYSITSNIFYDGTVTNNAHMKSKRAYVANRRHYSSLFAGGRGEKDKNKNHIQFHLLTNAEKRLDSRSSHSKYNVMEARIAVQYIKRFILELHYREKEIAVISDYAAQIDCVYAHLTRIKGINPDKMLLCTTNEIEGSSAPIVIYMCCRSNHTGNIGFLNDITRINVATSRAQYGQIIIGDVYTLQYNPIYRQIFNFHQTQGAVVYNEDGELLKVVRPHIPLIGVSLKHFLNKLKVKQESLRRKHLDYYVCGGCNRSIRCKLFCGRIVSAPPMFIYICHKCIDRHLRRWCDASIKHEFETQLNAISPMTVVHESDLNGGDSFGINLEFDLLLARYLVREGLTKFTTDLDNHELHRKFIGIAKQIVNEIESNTNNNFNVKNWKRFVPQCFQTLSEYTCTAKKEDIRSDPLRSQAIGIMECRRNHLLKQAMMDARFFRLVYEIKNCKIGLQRFYTKHKLNFYTYPKFQVHQPTLIVVAYLKACGYSTNIANYLHRRVAKLLVDKNKNKASRNTAPLPLDEAQIRSLAQYLKLDELNAINNVFLSRNKTNNGLNGQYVIKLVQNAVIDDRMSAYYEERKHANAIEKEGNFGDDLRSAGFDYYSEKQLQELGYKDTPDYYLKKPWIVQYGDCKYEITWIDFKNYYCSSTQWVQDKLRFQATRYNKTFGPGAFVFSLGFVKVPNANKCGLQLNSHGLLAALPFTKDTILKFIRQTKKYKAIVSK